MFTKLANVQQVLSYRRRQHENEVSRKYSDVQKVNSYRVRTRLFNSLRIDITNGELDLLARLLPIKIMSTPISFLQQTKAPARKATGLARGL